ncbi:hypothetical protein OH799_06885 [Nocardia sp. NBC_00881]|uniref:hypothetical protein n=1 Tax=Nocardia sp. NBC_00881 TaxID=2975995 RepID=UPI00386939B9|nr:hypothetical protein OH799_06885 [Nocardia sp. NBC_00881]
MTDLQEWEQQLQQDLAEIHGNSQQLAKQAAGLRGRGEVRGVLVEVDTAGAVTNLQIAPGAMKWTNTQLTSALLDCHRKARTDAKAKVERLLQKSDPRIRNQANLLKNPPASRDRRDRPMSEAELRAADDAYFERRNLHGGWTDR